MSGSPGPRRVARPPTTGSRPWLAPVCLWMLVLALGTTPGAVPATAADNLEVRIKSAFLYKFCGYVEWPDSAFTGPDSPVVIGVAANGSKAIARELEQAIAGRTVHNRPLAMRTVRPGERLDGIHLLFIGREEGARLGDFVALAQGLPVLLVTDIEAGLDRGGMINFVVLDNRIRFDISLATAKRHNLWLSSQLLGVARDVRRTAP